MKIGYLDALVVGRSTPGKAGLSDLVWDLAKGIVPFGDEVHIFGSYETLNYPIKGANVHNYKIPKWSDRNILTQMLIHQNGINALHQIKELQIIHVPDYLSSALLTFSRSNIPIVLTTPGSIFERISRYNPFDPVTTLVYKWAARRSAHLCARIIATSKDMRKWWLLSGAKDEQIINIPLTVDTDLFFHLANSKHVLGWSYEELHLLFVGRLYVENRVELLLESFAHFLAISSENVRLHIVGDGPQKRELQAVAEKKGVANKITWHGSVNLDQLSVYYSAADLFIFPRPAGATPRVILQAMMCGTPILAVANESVTEYIIDNLTGLYVESTNPLEIAHRIQMALNHLEKLKELGQNARGFAMQNFSIDVVAKRVREEVYIPLVK